jgi:SAM-dependent methyltransferase
MWSFQLARQFQALGPWITRFEINKRIYGGSYEAAKDERLKLFFKHHPNPGRVLELGCLEGGHTFPIAKKASEVIAIDSRDHNLEKARWLAEEVFETRNVEFREANLETFDLGKLGSFDVCFNVGVLYHLPEPWVLLSRLAKNCRSMFLWTHYAPEHEAGVVREGYNGMLYREFGPDEPLSGMSELSFWPSMSELMRMLDDTGFEDVNILEDEDRHPHGPAVLLTCRSKAFVSRSGDGAEPMRKAALRSA